MRDPWAPHSVVGTREIEDEMYCELLEERVCEDIVTELIAVVKQDGDLCRWV